MGRYVWWGIDLLSKVVIVGIHISRASDIPARRKRDLVLRRLRLLPPSLRRLLLLHLLIAQRRQAARNLLDLVRRQVLGELLGELLQEDDIVRLGHVGRQQRNERLAHALKLQLGLRVEQRQLREVDSRARVLGVKDNGVGSSLLATVVADAYSTEKVLGVSEISLLLRATQAFTAGTLILIRADVAVPRLEEKLLGGDALSYALGLGLLARGGLCVGLGLLRSCDLGLLALNLGVLGCIPGV